MSFQYTSGDPADLVGGTDASMADIQGPFNDLRDFLNTRIAGIPTVVTGALPGSPADGQEIYYLADAANGVVWHLRYRSASGSSSKWEGVGTVSPLSAETAGAVSTSSASFVDIDGTTPSITVPLAGDYMIQIGARISNNTIDGGGLMTPKIGAAASSDGDAVVSYSSTVNAEHHASRLLRRNGLAASAVVKLQYRLAGPGAASFARRTLQVWPVRVG
jgi:hypothetical protein